MVDRLGLDERGHVGGDGSRPPAGASGSGSVSPQLASRATAGLRPSLGPGRTRADGRVQVVAAGGDPRRRSKTPEDLPRNSSAESPKLVRRISWPPMTKSPGSGKASPSKIGSAVTRPVRSTRPLDIADRPRVIVVPTPPNAPTNQRPTR